MKNMTHFIYYLSDFKCSLNYTQYRFHLLFLVEEICTILCEFVFLD